MSRTIVPAHRIFCGISGASSKLGFAAQRLAKSLWASFYNNLSLGLKTLSERAKILGSQLILKSEKNQGTVISLNVPI